MKKTLLVAMALLACCVTNARERANRKPFETQFNKVQDKVATFTTDGAWVPYPKYKDRATWNEWFGKDAASIIKYGESLLDYKWKITTAMDYLEFEKDGDRKHIQALNQNLGNLGSLVMAELAEGKGRFIPQIINGLFFASERTTWQYAVHTGNQPSHRKLPEDSQRYISLGAANVAAAVSIAWYFFHEEFDKYDPSISRTIQKALDKNTFAPYLDDTKNDNHWWLGSGNGAVNNWNTYCNAFVIQSFLFAQQDQQKLIKGLTKAMSSVDNYMDYARQDGACEEGPSYWGMAGCKAYEIAALMTDASKGQMNLFGDDQLRRMCLWKSSVDLGDGWTVNYGDGGPRSQGGQYDLFWMGVNMDIQELRDLSVYLSANWDKKKWGNRVIHGADLYRCLESVRFRAAFEKAQNEALENAGGDWDKMRLNLRKDVKSIFFPDTQTAVLRNTNGWILAPKAGYNGESHNHNDVGNFILFIDECPLLIDQGSGTYGKTTFGPERYTANYHINSYGHNVPVINGQPQSAGDEFGAKNVRCDINKRSFSSDIAGAYAKDTQVKNWIRTVTLEDDAAVITDKFQLTARKAADDLHFITWGEAKITEPGIISIKARDFSGKRSVETKLYYPNTLTASIDVIEHTNNSLKQRWGKVYQISLKSSEKAPLSGSYTVKITR